MSRAAEVKEQSLKFMIDLCNIKSAPIFIIKP